MQSAERERWNASAEEYSRLAPQIAFYRDTATQLVASLPLKKTPLVADIACGSSGLVEEELIRKYPDLICLHCIDIAESMMAVLKRRFGDRRMRFHVGSAESASGHIHGEMDLVVVNSAFWLLDIPRTLASLSRLLGPSGVLAFNIAEWDLLELREEAHSAARYRLINDELAARGYPPKTLGDPPQLVSQTSLEASLKKEGLEMTLAEARRTRMTLEDWVAFYSIGGIARRSLPWLGRAEAVDVLTTAMRRFCREARVDAIAWRLFHAKHSQRS